MSNSVSLELPHILPSQAQKHVTHNEAMDVLDALVQLSVRTRSLATPPADPEQGSRYLVGANATELWAGHDGDLTLWLDGGWLFRTPREGWRVWVEDEQQLLILAQSGWQAVTRAAGAGDNALINGAFDIWQRGHGPHAGTPTGQYGADRWRMQTSGSATVTMTRSSDAPDARFSAAAHCAVANVGASDRVSVTQIVEHGARLLATGAVSLAFWLKGPVGASVSFGVDGALTHHTCSGDWEHVTTTFYGLIPDPAGWSAVTLISQLDTDGDYLFTGAAFGAGANVDFALPRSPATEEVLCRRYYERLGGGGLQLGRIQNAFGAAVALHPVVQWSAPKRMAPTLTVLGDINDGPQQMLGILHTEPTHAVLDQTVPAYGWLDIDYVAADAEYY